MLIMNYDYEKRLNSILNKKKFDDEVKQLIKETFKEIYKKYDESNFAILNPQINKLKYINRLMNSLEKCSSIVIVDKMPGLTSSKSGDEIFAGGMTNVVKKSITLQRYPQNERIVAKYSLAHELEHLDQGYNIYLCQYVYASLLYKFLCEGAAAVGEDVISNNRCGSVDVIDDKTGCKIQLNKFSINSMDYMFYCFFTHALGYQFMENWRLSKENKDYIFEAKKILTEKYGQDIANKFFDKLAVLLIKQNEEFDNFNSEEIVETYPNFDIRKIPYYEVLTKFKEYKEILASTSKNSKNYIDVFSKYESYKKILQEYEVLGANPQRYEANRKHSIAILKKIPTTNLFDAIIGFERIIVECWKIEISKLETLEELYELQDVIGINIKTLLPTFSGSYDITEIVTGLSQIKIAIQAKMVELIETGNLSRLSQKV